jgi:addiction module RelB/DinJ family antitoxin
MDMKTILNVKTDIQVKQNAQKLAADLGVSLSTVVNAYLRQFIRDREVSFSLAYRMTPELEVLLGPVERDIRHGKNLSPALNSTAALKKYLEQI